jgi:hypothetical protein
VVGFGIDVSGVDKSRSLHGRLQRIIANAGIENGHRDGSHLP